MPELSSRRTRWIYAFISIGLIVCAINLMWIQVIKGPELAAEGQRVRTHASAIPAKRGTILDAQGVTLAESVQAYHIAVNQRSILSYIDTQTRTNDKGRSERYTAGRGPAHAARQLAPLLGMNEAELGGLMIGDQTYVYLKKNVDPVTYRKIRELGIYGIEWESVFERQHPNGNTAGPIIGAINGEFTGVSGLELMYDQILQGQSGEEAYEIAPNGAILPGGKQIKKEPHDGATITTTLHADLQHLVQEQLDERTKLHEAAWGSVVILDIPTGRILVMADSSSIAPESSKPQPVSAVQYAFEPGSVGKVITIAAALEKGSVTPTTAFTVPDRIEPGDAGGPITDFHEHPTMGMTTTGILADSSNVGTVMVGETITDQDRYDLMKKFGLGELTNVELPGESAGIIRPADQWRGRDRYVTMFGQAYTVNVLQEASLMATIGNGGVHLPPRLIDSWTLADNTTHTPDPVEPTQALSAQTAHNLIKMMESTVNEKAGTGQAAKVEGYRVAVKTGTADIFVDGRPTVVSTTAGIVPANAPRLAIAVVLYDPKIGVLSSESSAPLFGQIVGEAVRSLQIPASPKASELFPMYPQ